VIGFKTPPVKCLLWQTELEINFFSSAFDKRENFLLQLDMTHLLKRSEFPTLSADPQKQVVDLGFPLYRFKDRSRRKKFLIVSSLKFHN
jgi:hypothetical protein